MEPRSIPLVIIEVLAIITLPFLLVAGFGIYGAVRPHRIVSDVVPETFGYDYGNVTLETEDGLSLAAWYIPRKGAATDKAVIVLHGYPADKGDLLPRASFLVDRYNVLFVDMRYFGQSEGAYTTVGAKETQDLRAAVEYLQGRGMERIGVYGFSMGGAVALMGQAEIDGIDAVVAEASYADLRTMTSEMYRYIHPLQRPLTWTTAMLAKVLFRTDIDEVSPEKAIKKGDASILLAHSRGDEVVPFRNAERIIMAAADREGFETFILDTGTHGEPSIEFAQTMASFFAEHLGLPDDLVAANGAGTSG
jgi:dipeptidyl aminopeptidase/acylaminoacyl peptidase